MSKLSHLIQFRRYDDLEVEIDDMVRMIGWDQAIHSFKVIWESGDTSTINTRTFNSSWNQEILQLSIALDEFRRGNLRVPIGKTRDCIIRLLELEPVTGLDADLLNEFAD